MTLSFARISEVQGRKRSSDRKITKNPEYTQFFLPHKSPFCQKTVPPAPFSYFSFVSGHKGTNKRAKKTNLFVFSRAKVPSFSRLRLGEGLARRPIGKAKAAEPSARPQTWLKGTVERRGMQINHPNLPIFLICEEGRPHEHFPR